MTLQETRKNCGKCKHFISDHPIHGMFLIAINYGFEGYDYGDGNCDNGVSETESNHDACNNFEYLTPRLDGEFNQLGCK